MRRLDLCGVLAAAVLSTVLAPAAAAPALQNLLLPALDASLRDCDMLDPAQCLLPFPNNAFTTDAAAGSPQSEAKGGTGRRVSINVLATPRNLAGKPVDPGEWNRNDGFSPGALITTYVPGLSLEKTFARPADRLGIANIGLSQLASAPILVLEVPQVPESSVPRKHLVWSELDANAAVLLETRGEFQGIELPERRFEQPSITPALLVRPAKNFTEGRRYVVVLRNLRNATGAAIAAQDAFAVCRDKLAASFGLPALSERCQNLDSHVFPVLEAAGIARDESLFLAWTFTVASTANQIGRLKHMRDDAFASLALTDGADCTQHADDGSCRAPAFSVDRVTDNPRSGIARRIEGTLTVPSYLVPVDPAPGDDAQGRTLAELIRATLPEEFEPMFEVLGIGAGVSAPPNRLNYLPDESSATACAGVSPQDVSRHGCEVQARYGDGLPDASGTMSVPFMCQVPSQATPDVPARAGIYGHGLLDSRVAITYDGVPQLSSEFNYMFCAVDWFGFATGDLPNVASTLVDLSNFPVIPDSSQQGMLNFMFLARLIRHPGGFASSAAFQDPASQRPLFDRSEVVYDGNSQGGILGGVVMAASKDVNRGALGSLGMNYSTLLNRSKDFDVYAIPLYLSYQNSLDRQLLFSMMQMLWDRSENNGYAAHLVDNSAFGGPTNAAKLDPQFGDQQVTMWSAEVMARTMGVRVDASHSARVAAQLGQARRHPDLQPYRNLRPLDYANAAHTRGGALVVWDDVRTAIPPIENLPNREGRDPHDDSAKKYSGRCQKAHFLRRGGRLVDVAPVEFDGAACPGIPPAPPTAAVDPGSDGLALVYPFSERECLRTAAGFGVPGEQFCAALFAVPYTANYGCGSAARAIAGSQGAALCDALFTPVPATATLGAPNASCNRGTNLAGNRSYQVTLGSDSGERISFQVLEPAQFDCANAGNGAHPLVLHGHGFGGSRSQNGFASYRNTGYTVISIDQRGFGDSSGTVRTMDPDHEGKDLLRILDWAEANLDYLAWRNERSPLRPFVKRPASHSSVPDGANLVVGSIGGSYGGGYQLLIHAVDAKDRLDAMAPDITWHDLRYSLNPGDVLKSAWDLLLVAGGEAGSYAPGTQNGEAPTRRGLDPYIKEVLGRGIATGEFPNEALEWFRYHSPTYWCGLNGQPTMRYDTGRNSLIDPNFMLTGLAGDRPGSNTRSGQPPVDVLLSQGMRDTLFNFNDAWWNYQCLAMRGGDVRMITHQGGHVLADFVPVDAVEFQQPGGTNNCGDVDRAVGTLEWLNQKLRNAPASAELAGTENSICVSLSDNDAVKIPVKFMQAPRASEFTPSEARFYEVRDAGASSVAQGVLAQNLHLSGAGGPSVVPLADVTGRNGAILAGIAAANITLTTPQRINDIACGVGTLPTTRSGCDAIVFVGLGVKRLGASEWQLIDDQIMPVRGLGEHQNVHLVGVGERLQQGDALALLVYGYHPQYLASYSRDPSISVVNVGVDIKLPLYAGTLTGLPAYRGDPATAMTRTIGGGCTDSHRTDIDPACFAQGNAAHVVRALCDYQWLPGACEAVAFGDPAWRADADPSPGAPLFQAIGAVHEHSGYSDGDPTATPRDYFRAGRYGHNISDDGQRDTGAKIDFMISSEHSENEKLAITTAAVCVEFYQNPANWQRAFAEQDPGALVSLLDCSNLTNPDHYHKWQAALQQAREETQTTGEGESLRYTGFTGMRGFEWTNDYYNHMNVYFSTNVINAKVDGSYLTMSRMWDWLRKPVSQGGGADALVTFNHPGGNPSLTPFDGSQPHNELLNDELGGSNWDDLAYVPDVDANVVGIEVNGGDDIEWYVKALTRGWHLGPVAAEDEHQREWSTVTDGKTLILSKGRSPRDYYFALKNRRTAAVRHELLAGTPGARMVAPRLWFWTGLGTINEGRPMGSIVREPGRHPLRIAVRGVPAGTPVALVSSQNGQGTPIQLGLAGATGEFNASYPVNAPLSGEDWYFMVVCPVGETNCGGNRNHLGVTAPIWFGPGGTNAVAGTDALDNLSTNLSTFLSRLFGGDMAGALATLQGAANQFGGDVALLLTGRAGDAAGLALPPPAPGADPELPAPQPLLAGIAKRAIRVPVGVPLGGYLRPPVGGDYLPGLEGFAEGDPSAFFTEFLDFLPTEQDHDGVPLAPLPDELRTVHSPYATFSPPSRGYYDSLVAKAVVLYDGNDYVVLLKTDFIGMLDELVHGVVAKVKADTGVDLQDGLIMSASHSHGGPGALANHSTRYFWLAMDAYQPELYNRLVPQFAEVVKQALNNLQPARFGHGMGREGYAHPTEGNKKLNSFRRSRLATYDTDANNALRERIGVMRIDTAQGEPLAVVMNYAAHGIAFDVENLYFSGDVLGAAEREVESQLRVPLAMLVQNTGGDISPRADGAPKLQRVERFGKLLAPQVANVWRNIRSFDAQPDLRSVSQRVILSRERLGYTGDEYPYQWGAAQCWGVEGAPEESPMDCLQAPPPDPIDLADNGVAENGAFVPQDTRITVARIGSALLLAQPGEPLTEYGVRLLDVAGRIGFAAKDTFIWGYSQDHIGYILAPEEADWRMGGTEGTTTFWGWKQGQRLLDVNRDLIVALRNGSAPPADEFQVNYFYQDLYDRALPPPVIPSLQPGRIVVEPANIARFAQTAFAWEGGDPVVDLPTVTLQRQDAEGNWQPARRDNGEVINTFFEMHLKYRLETGAHIWRVEFEAAKDWPLGRYRFDVSGSARQAADAPYALTSQGFEVTPARDLQISDVALVDGYREVTLDYVPRPGNYRLIDALVSSERAAPVRKGMVAFTNGTQTVLDARADLVVRNGRLVALFRTRLNGTVTVSGADVYGNTTPNAGPLPPGTEVDNGTGAIAVLADFFGSLGDVMSAALAGDFATAGEQLSESFAGLGDGFAGLFLDDSASLMAMFTNAAANLAGGDPQGFFNQGGDDLGAVVGLDADPVTFVTRAGGADRSVAPVVLTGAQLPGWSQPAAQGTPYPYPSGATTTGSFFPMDELSDNRSAHNGAMIYPAGWTPGDPGTSLPNAAPVNQIAGYAFSGGAWREIPLQVDERYPYFLANANSDFSVYSGTDEELTYAWDVERWAPADSADGCTQVPPAGTPDPVANLDDDDEVVFMWRDAGDFAAPGTDAPAGTDTSLGYQQVALSDPLNPSSLKFVYLFRKSAGSAFAYPHYVRYQRDANADQWIDRGFFADNDPEKIGTSNTGYGPNLSGTVCQNGSTRQSNDRFPRDGVTVTSNAYRWYASGRWMLRELNVAKPGQPGQYGIDLVDRWKGRAFQQSPDSVISLVGFEDEQVNWEANSVLLGERCGPVRCMREVWGADSGTNVTKLETFWPDAIAYRYHVRVHPIPPDGLYTAWDYNRSAMLPGMGENVPAGRYYTMLRPQGVPVDGRNDDIGSADGFSSIPTPNGPLCPGSDGLVPPGANGQCRAYFDAADPTFNLALAFDNWEQVSGKGDSGSLVYIFEMKGATSGLNPLVVPYYRDDACLDDGTGDDPVKRPWPGESYVWNGGAVQQAYNARAGRALDYTGALRADCEERQGAYGAHGIHYFLTHDSDNMVLLGKPNTEIDGQQWQFAVPTSRPVNVGELYSNNVRVPVVPVVTPLAAP